MVFLCNMCRIIFCKYWWTNSIPYINLLRREGRLQITRNIFRRSGSFFCCRWIAFLRAMEHEALALNSADNVARGMYRLSIERIDTQLDTWRKEYMWQPLLLWNLKPKFWPHSCCVSLRYIQKEVTFGGCTKYIYMWCVGSASSATRKWSNKRKCYMSSHLNGSVP